MFDDANITLTSLRIICNYIGDTFGKRDILHEEEVHNLRTWLAMLYVRLDTQIPKQ